VTRRYRLGPAGMTDEGDSVSRTDVRVDDLETADAPVTCD
jgi:hypothetical protein